jgi:hypothetical protein
VQGLAGLQPHLDDPDVTDIHIRGHDSVWLKLRDGTRRPADPVATSDEELVELVRVIAARMGRSERRFDAANPELNIQLPDGSRLFATMEVSSRPSVVIRRHWFELSWVNELAERGMIDRALKSFLAGGAGRRNPIIAGGTGTGKTIAAGAPQRGAEARASGHHRRCSYELAIDRFEDRHPTTTCCSQPAQHRGPRRGDHARPHPNGSAHGPRSRHRR